MIQYSSIIFNVRNTKHNLYQYNPIKKNPHIKIIFIIVTSIVTGEGAPDPPHDAPHLAGGVTGPAVCTSLLPKMLCIKKRRTTTHLTPHLSFLPPAFF